MSFYDVPLPPVPVPAPRVPVSPDANEAERMAWVREATVMLTRYQSTFVVGTPHSKEKGRRKGPLHLGRRHTRGRFEPHYATRARKSHDAFVAVRTTALADYLRKNDLGNRPGYAAPEGAQRRSDVLMEVHPPPPPMVSARTTTAPPDLPALSCRVMDAMTI
jgi:hypothetical protein